MGFFKIGGSRKQLRRTESYYERENRATEHSKSMQRKAFDKAYDDYLAGRITKAQFNKKLQRIRNQDY